MKIARRTAPFILLLGILCLTLVLPGGAATAAGAGDLDPTFGQDGKVTTAFAMPLSTDATGMAVQPDGKTVQVGNRADGLILARYNPDGSLDAAFGTDGWLFAGNETLPIIATAVAVTADGKIVVAGTTAPFGEAGDFAVARFNADGSLDMGFGAGGLRRVDLGGNGDSALALASAADGKIVLAGTASGAVKLAAEFGVARLNPDGSLDAGFGAGGATTISFDGLELSDASAVALAADGKIVVAGSAFDYSSGSNGRFAVARLNPDGSLDNTFNGGRVTVAFPDHYAFMGAMALLPDGKIALGGTVYVAMGDLNWNFGLARLAANGTLDPTFGAGGMVITDASGQSDRLNGLVALADGRLVAGGFDDDGRSAEFLLARYTVDGSLDASFGTGGKVSTPFTNLNAAATALTLLPDGKLLLGGTQAENPTYTGGFGLLRYNPDGSLDVTFGSGGMIATLFDGPVQSMARVALGLPNGQFLVAGLAANSVGKMAVARFGVDGALDHSFGRYGQTIVDFDYEDTIGALVVDAAGRILLGGSAESDSPLSMTMALARLNPDGTPDESFGLHGKVRGVFPGNRVSGTGLVVLPDGKIEQVGYGQSGVALARYLPDGSFDPSFDGDGRVTINLGNPMYPLAAALDGTGKVIAVAGDYANFVLLRFNDDGSLDSTFGSGGKAAAGFDGLRAQPYALRVQPDGRILVAGSATTGQSEQFGLMRFSADGSLDATFGNGGKVLTDFGGAAQGARQLAVQPDGKIVVVGVQGVPGSSHFGLLRYNADGSLDNTFGSGGKASASFGANEEAVAVVLQPGGRIVVAGNGYAFPTGLVLAGFLSAPPPPPPTPTSGPGCILSDVCPSDYWFAPVQSLIGRGAISGYDDNTFRPTNNATRSQLAKIVVLALGWDLVNPQQPTFADVPQNDTFYKYVETAVAHHAVGGYSDGNFRPYNSVTRGQLSKIITLAAGWPQENPATPTFSDVPRDNPFFGFIETAHTHGVISGYADGTFKWTADATRGQIAKIVYLASSR